MTTAPAFSLEPLLNALVAATPADVACGGAADGPEASGFVIDELVGVRTDGLRHLRIERGHGVGGKALALGRPVHVRSYHDARGITHRYDAAVREERLRAMFALPVRVPGGPGAVVYGAMRGELLISDTILDAATRAVRDFEREVAVGIEVDRRLRELLGPVGGPAHGPDAATDPAAAPQRIRQIYAELALIAASLDEGAGRDRVRDLMGRIAGTAGPARADRPPTELTARETDVLAHVALGCTNGEIAERLGILTSTVKWYLKEASRKLGARNRVEAVALARSRGLLP